MATTKAKKTRNQGHSMDAIEVTKAYPLRVFYKVSGYGATAVSSMRQEAEEMGCPFHVERGRKVMILGGKFIEYMTRCASPSS